MKRRFVDSRHGPVTVISGEELKKRFPTSEGFLAPTGISVRVTENYFDAPINAPQRTVTITDTELLGLAKTSADKLNPKERQALALFRIKITQKEELTEGQQGFLYNIIETCRHGPVRQKTILSPEEKARRNLVCNALVALLGKKATGEQVLLIFSKEVLEEARTALSLALRDITVLSQNEGLLTHEQIVNRVLSHVIERIGYSVTHSFLAVDDFIKKPYRVFFGAIEQESATHESQTFLGKFPKALEIALQDHPRRLTSEKVVEIIDGMYSGFIAENDGTFSVSSVDAINVGAPGSGKGGVHR